MKVKRQPIRWKFLFFSLLATIHIPLYEVNDKAVGLFDLVLVVLCVFAALRYITHKLPTQIPYKCLGFALLLTFTAYAGITLAANWTRPMLSLIPEEGFAFPTLLYIKQIEYIFTILCTVYVSRKIDAETVAASLALSLAVISLYGFYAMFIAKAWYRLGLINMSGEVSSNPGGFVISILLLCSVALICDTQFQLKRFRFALILALATGYLALIFSYSRTNNISFLICCGLLLLPYLRRHLLLACLVLVPVVVAGNLTFVAFSSTQDLGHYGISPLTFLAHPSLIINDPSLRLRIEEVWGLAFREWSSSPATMIFGIGFGKLRLADGLYPNLLFTTGVVGVLLYLAAFVVSLWRAPLILRCLILFVLLNGISTETTINSFRSAQVFYTIYPAMMLLFEKGKRPNRAIAIHNRAPKNMTIEA